MAVNESIYTGFWINWSKGRVSGATVTLQSRDAAVLNAFIAVLLSFAGTRLWRMLTYALHQTRYRKAYVDGLEHQQRVILRNSSNPGPTAWSLLLQYAFWRRAKRTLPLAVIALLYMAAVAAFSILVPSYLQAEPIRLLSPSNCGDFNTGPTRSIFAARLLKFSQEGSLYSQTCYEPSTSNLCQSQPVFETTFVRNASCPFADGMCYMKNSSVPISMTTAMIDSRDDIGINLQERVTFRSATTCSILSEAGYTQTLEGQGSGGDAVLITYNYGPVDSDNVTFVYSTLSSTLTPMYNVQVVHSAPGVSGMWTPTPGLNRTDADVTAVFVTGNAILSETPIDDPMFASHGHPIHFYPNNKTVIEFEHYLSDHYGTVIGCAAQYQLCNPDTNTCSRLQSLNQTFASRTTSSIGLTKVQEAIAGRIYKAAFWSQLHTTLNTRAGSALRASSTLSFRIQPGLPNDQYLREIQSWYTTGLSMFQKAARNFAVGDGTNVEPTTSLDQTMCSTQRTLNLGDTLSFRLLYLLVVILLSFTIIGLSYVLETIVSWLQQHIGRQPCTSNALWKLDDTLQLQRSLFQNLGYGKWTNSSWTPTTSDQPFGEVDFTVQRDPQFTEQTQSSQVGFEETEFRKGAVADAHEVPISYW